MGKEWTIAYLNQIKARIEERRKAIGDQLAAITDGRVMPGIEDLNIGYARELNVCVFFFDIQDSSKRTDVKKAFHMLNLTIPEAMNLVRDYGGTVEKNTGDGVMAIFGANTADHTTKATDAVGCAIAIRYVIQTVINPLLAAAAIEPVKFRMGIDKGSVLIAKIGIRSLNFLTAVGASANVASQLQEVADTDGVCIGGSVYDHLPDSWRKLTKPFAPPNWTWTISQQGKRVPYPVYLFTGVRLDPKQ